MRLPPALVIAALALTALPARAEDGAVTVFAAASLKTALDQIAAEFGAKTGGQVTISYAGSNQLARQIIQGAPADIYLSANARWMDEVENAGLVADGTRQDLLGNRLVLIAHGKANVLNDDQMRDLDLPAMLGDEKLAMALVDAVPAGQYGKAALESLGLWDDVAPHVAQADNVRAALALVATGEAPLGIVYATDAAAEDDVSVIGEFPADSHPPITYPVALTRMAQDPADRAFYDLLSSPQAATIFEAAGFTVLTPPRD
ncbi:molybdate ABC transporter substrate-binding protein [Paracoccus fistulariae]|uniref:Molybdate ABC transporter substrate-binding protein n=1 Tax=Paracoccus fistulariae TaxID=658446 RepID=A0ABY7SM44_9RHOB|nr:molybdate ABC transporter substrate-binding protein [Paracoccus fistulariae]MDB6179855.1 molybdate ABC transporter substrate-binding protein [Paracoccus fistulariae]WCR07959.1 molybdate ABC transporter substrate-binding protein [Paracoccus fistulariae]